MSRFRKAAALMLLGALSVPSLAYAQEQPTTPSQSVHPREVARFQFGLLYFAPELSIDRVGYDSNVFNADGAPKGDFTASVTPQSRIWIPFARRALLTTDVAVDFVYYKDSTNLRSVRPRINAQGELYARRFTLFAEAGTSRDLRQPNIEIEQRVRLVSDNLGGGVRFGLQRGLSIAVSAFRRSTGFDDNEVVSGINLNDTLGRVEHSLHLAVREQLTSLTAVGLNFETRKDRFNKASGRDADGYRLSGTIDLAPKALVSGTAELGYRHLDPADPLVPAFNGLVASVAIANRIGGTWESTLVWDRDTEYSLDAFRPYFLTNTLTARVRRQIAGQFDTSVGASRTRSHYRSTIDVTTPSGMDERLMAYTLDIGYRLSRASRAAFGVTHSKRTSSLSDRRKYSTTLAAFSLNYVF